MLKLKRRLHETITVDCLGTEITIHVCRLTGQTVTIGVDAPLTVKVLRSELDQREVITDLPAHDGPESRQ
jgi:carbon storage regulator CsrA